MRVGLALAALVASGCGRLAFDPVGSGGVDEENVAARPIVAAGNQFTCVRRGDGSVWCWGEGRKGQLGQGPELPRSTPARVPTLPAVVAVEAGNNHACAVTEQAEIWCWGNNDYGQVDGGSGDRTPTRVPLPRSATAVAAGAYHTCAILDDQSVSCWGKNSAGQIGKGPLSGDHVLVHDVLDRATAITTGNYHTCAVRDGTVWCWGLNGDGQIGDGTHVDAESPTSIGLAATSVSGGGYYSCALDAGGHFRCWGDNGAAQLGTTGTALTPAPPSALDGFVALRGGGSHTCAIRDDASLWCWGENTLGTLGDGSGTGAFAVSQAPIQIKATRADVAAGSDHTCAVDADGAVECWGAGRFGAIGDPVRAARLRAQEVALPAMPLFITAGSRFACAVLAPNQALYCWGDNTSGQLALSGGTVIDAPHATSVTNVETLSLGHTHSCGSIDGTLSCWGSNGSGQLGDGTTDGRFTPMPVAGTLTGVASGRDFSCGITSTNDVFCWGSNEFGKLGAGGANETTPIMNGVLAANLDLGDGHACAREGGTATCWGLNERGQLGRGTPSASETPGAVAGLISWQTLTTGSEHTCGTDGTGALYCWGMNVEGMLGTGDGDDRPSPTQIVAAGGREITARHLHTCAEIDGSGHCWGYNATGQLGDGTVSAQNSPTPILDIPPGVAMFALGDEFSCVLSSDGKVRCWGDNTYGQLGIGVLGFAASPTAVALP